MSETRPRNRVAPISGIKGSKGSDSGGRGNLLHLTAQLFTPTPLFPSFYFLKVFLETGGKGDFFLKYQRGGSVKKQRIGNRSLRFYLYFYRREGKLEGRELKKYSGGGEKWNVEY